MKFDGRALNVNEARPREERSNKFAGSDAKAIAMAADAAIPL
jgi:hypothetical protein